LRMDGSGAGQTYYQQYGAYYQGVSGQDLFDYQFTKTNGYGVTQDCFRVILVDRTNPLQTITGGTANKVGSDFVISNFSYESKIGTDAATTTTQVYTLQ
ncbi:MAG: hypothetical protein WCJ62_09690, partial [Flavobacterium sp.]